MYLVVVQQYIQYIYATKLIGPNVLDIYDRMIKHCSINYN